MLYSCRVAVMAANSEGVGEVSVEMATTLSICKFVSNEVAFLKKWQVHWHVQ